MFDKKGFIAFVGSASGTMYANGLANIEKTYNVDIDAEVAHDNCVKLLGLIDTDKKQLSDNDRHTRQNWSSHLKKYVEFKRKQPVETQKQRFVAWFRQQPQKKQPEKLYADATINGAVNLLQSGLLRLGVPGYENVNCFTITDAEEFQVLHTACYVAATEFDKNAGVGDFRNGLDFYLQFLTEATTDTETIKKIRFILSHYKDNFAEVSKEERYKWEAQQWYKQHWDIDAPDFAVMLKNAFSKTGNLLNSGPNSLAYSQICQFSADDPEGVRAAFSVLYDETKLLEDRIVYFKKVFSDRIQEIAQQNPDWTKKLSSFQDLHAISVYLAFEYPEKYFIYKASCYVKFAKRVGFIETSTAQNTSIRKLENLDQLCRTIISIVSKYTELLALHKDRLDASCYQDEALHFLAQDIVFYGSNYMPDELFELDGQFWPSLAEYDPKLTKDDWKKYIMEVELPNHPQPMQMLKALMEQNGQASCKRLSELYGGTPNRYVGCSVNLGRRAKKYFNLPACVDEGQERFFAIPFVGKRTLEGDKEYYVYRIRPELFVALKEIDLSGVSLYVTGEEETMNTVTDVGLNTILYGPPGTGKTYHTVIYAVAIIENKELDAVKAEAYQDVLDRYNEYKAQGRIEFTTFHQSYGYEEFIEGIRPTVIDESDETESGNIQYSVQPGVFMKFCEKADCPISVHARFEDLGIPETATVWKVSLYGTGDNEIRTECMQNDHIRIGWDQYGKDITDETDFSVDGGRVVLNAFINKMQIGDIVFSCYSASTIDAIGIVTGEYEWHDKYEKLKRVRKVNWIVKGIRENILALNGGRSMTLASVYRLSNIAMSDVFKVINKYQPIASGLETHKDNFVFIIDEINRGNISKIFGELITLIEESKRVGKEEGMKTLLPYSMKPFGVPENVYIIGTMNTADRSIATIDTALRRRFEFKEMLPDPEVVAKISVGNLSIKELLAQMNRRIAVLYDREHTIGHAYFMPLAKDNSMEKLAEIFKNKVIPLLQEYFYEDYEKIRLVLADNQKETENDRFIKRTAIKHNELFGSVDVNIDEGYTYEINEDAFMNPEAYLQI